MAKPLLPLKQILEGDYKSLTQSFREVAQQDSASPSYRTEYPLDQLIQLIPDLDLATSPSENGFLAASFEANLTDWSPYKTDSPTALIFCETLIGKLYGAYRFHPLIEPLLRKLALLILLSLSKRTEAIVDSNHPVRQFTEQLFQAASIWEPAGGRTGKALLKQLQVLVNKLPDFDTQSNEAWKQQSLALEAIDDATLARTEILEQRLRESTLSDPQTQKMQQLVSRWINRKLNNKPLPANVLLFIRLELIADLQYLVVHEGDKHPTWAKWQKLLHLFSWIFKETSDTDDRQKKMQVILPVVEDLDQSYYEELADPQKYEKFLSELSDSLIGLIQGTPQPVELYTATIEEQNSTPLKQSAAIQNDDFEEQQWFVFNTVTLQGLRAKLLIKASDQDTLIFVNCHAKKVFESNFEEFSLQLATKDCLPIRRHNLFKQALFEALKSLELQHRENLKARKLELDKVETAKLQAAEKAQLEAQQIKQREEAEKLAREQELKRRSEVSNDQLEHYTNQIKALHVGAWLGFHDRDGNIEKLKLSVKLASTGRYIFTDRLGQPVSEKSLEELLDLMIANRLDIIRGGENFDNRLEKIVQGLRKPRDQKSL
ncbi:MAG: hypothetical protein AseanaTS_18130 [Candidatus Pelagadaptatus aseana]|uniref:DUF1631 family protein n=1 Tax=Candidatus Pelagadaptatus aseana TaxID=3120508 RepID=UPI0039B31B7C